MARSETRRRPVRALLGLPAGMVARWRSPAPAEEADWTRLGVGMLVASAVTAAVFFGTRSGIVASHLGDFLSP